MIIPFIMSLMTLNKHPYLWYFYKSLDMVKRQHWPIIAQERYFTKPSVLAEEGGAYNRLINNKEFVDLHYLYELPKDEDLDNISIYPIPQSIEDKLLKDTGSYNNAMAYSLQNRWPELEELLDKYLTDIENNSSEKIDAIITLCWYPSLGYVAAKHNIPVISNEIGLFREPEYLKTAYFAFCNLFDDEQEIAERYNAFKNVCQELPVLSRKDILSLVLEDNYLGYLNCFDMLPRYEMGVATGYSTWMPFLSKTLFNDEELLFQISSIYDQFIVRMHPADPAKATYPRYVKTTDNSANTIEFFLKCKRIASLGSNVSLESAYWNRAPYTALTYSSSYGQKHDLTDKEEYSIDILYLNFFAFCFLVPYSVMMDPEYIMWRLSKPSEEEIYKKHIEIYLKQRDCDYNELISLDPSDRMAYILKCRGYDDCSKLKLPANSPFKTKTKTSVPPEKMSTLVAENQALKREINQHIATEKKYEMVLAERKSNEAEYKKLRADYSKLQADHNKKIAEARQYKNAFESILNSTSWKITSPFRAIKNLIRRIFKRK